MQQQQATANREAENEAGILFPDIEGLRCSGEGECLRICQDGVRERDGVLQGELSPQQLYGDGWQVATTLT